METLQYICFEAMYIDLKAEKLDDNTLEQLQNDFVYLVKSALVQNHEIKKFLGSKLTAGQGESAFKGE